MSKLLVPRRRLLRAALAAPAICLAATVRPKLVRAQGNGYQPPDWQNDRTLGDVIVRFAPGNGPTTPAIKQILDHFKAKTANAWPIARAWMFSVDEADAEPLAQALDASGLVEDAHPNHLGKVHLTPNDPYYTGTSGTQVALTAINCPAAWDYVTINGNAYAPVIDIDSGVQSTHPDFTQAGFNTPFPGGIGYNVLTSQTGVANCGDTLGHGTLIAGLVAAQTNDSVGVASVPYGGVLIPIEAFNTSSVPAANVLTSYQWIFSNLAAPGIINQSYSVAVWNSTYDDALTALWNKGFLLFCASGDGVAQGEPTTTCANGPTQNEYAIGVTGVLSNLTNPSWGPSYGPAISWTNSRGFTVANQPGAIISAPSGSSGENIWTTNNSSGYSNGPYGTSYSSPIAAAVAQMMWQVNKKMQNFDLFHLFVESGIGQNVTGFTGVSSPWNNPLCVDAAAFVKAAASYKGLPSFGRSIGKMR